MLSTRFFFPIVDGDCEAHYGLHKDVLGSPKEDIDEATEGPFKTRSSLAVRNAKDIVVHCISDEFPRCRYPGC